MFKQKANEIETSAKLTSNEVKIEYLKKYHKVNQDMIGQLINYKIPQTGYIIAEALTRLKRG